MIESLEDSLFTHSRGLAVETSGKDLKQIFVNLYIDDLVDKIRFLSNCLKEKGEEYIGGVSNWKEFKRFVGKNFEEFSIIWKSSRYRFLISYVYIDRKDRQELHEEIINYIILRKELSQNESSPRHFSVCKEESILKDWIILCSLGGTFLQRDDCLPSESDYEELNSILMSFENNELSENELRKKLAMGNRAIFSDEKSELLSILPLRLKATLINPSKSMKFSCFQDQEVLSGGKLYKLHDFISDLKKVKAPYVIVYFRGKEWGEKLENVDILYFGDEGEPYGSHEQMFNPKYSTDKGVKQNATWFAGGAGLTLVLKKCLAVVASKKQSSFEIDSPISFFRNISNIKGGDFKYWMKNLKNMGRKSGEKATFSGKTLGVTVTTQAVKSEHSADIVGATYRFFISCPIFRVVVDDTPYPYRNNV